MSDRPLDEIPLLDPARLATITGNDLTVTSMILHTFRDEAAEILTRIESVPEREDARREAHALKGAAGNVGALRLQEAARRFEAALLNEESADVVVTLARELRSSYKAFCDEVG